MELGIEKAIEASAHYGFDLNDVLAFLLATVIAVPIFRRLKLSSVLAYLAIGSVIGPFGLAVIDDVEGSALVAHFGVVFLLFTIGLELSVERLKSMRTHVFGLGFAQVFFTSASLTVMLNFGIGLPFATSIVIGGALALSSTAFVLQLLSERAEFATRFGQAAFAILLFQDLAVVPMLAMTPFVGAKGAALFYVLGEALLKAVIALVIIMFLGHKLLRPIYRMVAASRSPEVFTAMTLLLVLGIGAATSAAGLSMELGAFLAGLLLSESEYRHQVEADIRPFKGVLLGLFFISVGMNIDFGLFLKHAEVILYSVLGLMFFKTLMIFILMRLFRFEMPPSLRAAILLSQGGEFAFVIMNQAVPHGVVPEQIANIVFIVVAISMVLTPLLVSIGWYFTGRIDKSINTRLDYLAEKTGALSQHVVIAGFGRVGRTVAEILTANAVPFVAVEVDASRVAKGRAQAMPVYYGDACLAEVLRALGTARAKAIVLTLDNHKTIADAVTMIRLVYPEVDVYVRARDGKHVRELQHIGATATVPETLEASLQLGGAALRAYGMESDQVDEVIKKFRRQNISEESSEEVEIVEQVEEINVPSELVPEKTTA